MYGIEPGSNDIMLDIVAKDAFGLGGWKVVESSEQGMLARVKKNQRKEDWIVFLAWGALLQGVATRDGAPGLDAVRARLGL